MARMQILNDFGILEDFFIQIPDFALSRIF